MNRSWLMKQKSYRKLVMSVGCVGLFVAAADKLYVVREFIALFLGFCALFTVLAIAIFLILALEEAGRGVLSWFEAHTRGAHFLHLDTAGIPPSRHS